MSREAAEYKIAEKLKEIKAITEEYGMVSGYLTLTIMGDTIAFSNEHWSKDDEDGPMGRDYSAGKVLDYFENLKGV